MPDPLIAIPIAGVILFIGIMIGIILARSPDISNQDDDDRWWE